MASMKRDNPNKSRRTCEIAVALAFGVTFVEPFQPFHDQLRAADVELVESVATSG